MSDEWQRDLEVVEVDEVEWVDVDSGEVVEVVAVESEGIGPDGELVDAVVVDEYIDGELVSETVDIVVVDQDGEVEELVVEADFVEEPADLERPAATGDPRVDDALSLLDGLEQLPTTDQVGVFDDVHRRLQSALGDLDPGAAGS